MVAGVDKYEFKLKVDEMKALVSARNYNAAAEIAETINWRKIRNLNALVLAGEVFEQVGRYEESKEILLMAYDKSPIGRNIIYRLAEIAVKTKRFDEAQEYYDEFVDIAPHDNLKFVLKYKMTAAQGLPYQEQIKILEELKEQEYSEEWAYELAYLYHKDMQPEKCVEACDELILWFGDGIYVEKALELKMHYQPLTKPQEEKYRIFRQKRTGVIEVKPNDLLESGEIVHEAVEIPSVQTNAGQYNTANLQEEIAKGMQQISAVRMQKPTMQKQGLQNPQAAAMQPQDTQMLQGLQIPQAPQTAAVQPQSWQVQQKQPGQQLWQGQQKQPGQQFWQGQQKQPGQQLWQGQQKQPGQQLWQGQQVQQNVYTQPQMPQEPYTEPQIQQNLYMEPQEPFIRQPEQKPGWQEPTEQEPVSAVTMEKIQAEWEKTKQEMNDALREAEGAEQEESKERSFEKAEDLMQQLLGIVPQLAAKMEQQDLAGQNSAKVQSDLEQAGRIVAGINQLLQEQIDSLTAKEEQKQEPVLHSVSDPTREMPHLPENLLEGKEIGATDKVEMSESPLKKAASKNDDNPVMNAWKDAPPGISAIDLLQRVRMKKAAANEKRQTQAEHSDTESMQQIQPGHSAIESLRRMQTKNAAADPVLKEQMRLQHQMQDTALDSISRQMEKPAATAMRQTEKSDRNVMSQTEEPDRNVMRQMEEPDRNVMPQTENELYMQGMPSVDRADAVIQQEEVRTADTAMEERSLHLEDSANHTGIETGYSEENVSIGAEGPAENPGMQTGYPAENAGILSGYTENVNIQTGYAEDVNIQPGYTENVNIQPGYAENVSMHPEYAENTGMQPEYPAENIRMQPGYVENAGIQAGYPAENIRMQAGYPAADTGMESDDLQENVYKYSSENKNMEIRPEHPFEDRDAEVRPEYPSEDGDAQVRPEYPSEDGDAQVRPEYPLENNRRNARQEFENEKENLFLAAKPRFLTQAQLQAESVMNGNKSTQVTKEFSKEAMIAAHSKGLQENIPQADSQNMEVMKKLTSEQRQIFSYFVPIAGMEAQIYDLLMGVSEHLQYDKHAQSGNIIIEGISGSGKTVLIMDIIKVLQKEIKRPVGKTGKIDANALNQKDLDVLIDKISGGCLIIESAGKISRETAVRLSRCMENDHTGTLYILEDTEEGIQKALERDSSFAAKFTEKISIPLFSPDELVEFGKAYANDLNYDIDEMGVLALYKRIGAIQKLDHVTTLTEVKEIVDEAIDNAEKGVLKKVLGMLTATRANEDNYIILREKDFEDS